MDFQARSPKPDPLVILPPRPSSPSHEPPEAFAVPVEPESSRLNIRPGEAVRGRVRDHPQQAVHPLGRRLPTAHPSRRPEPSVTDPRRNADQQSSEQDEAARMPAHEQLKLEHLVEPVQETVPAAKPSGLGKWSMSWRPEGDPAHHDSQHPAARVARENAEAANTQPSIAVATLPVPETEAHVEPDESPASPERQPEGQETRLDLPAPLSTPASTHAPTQTSTQASTQTPTHAPPQDQVEITTTAPPPDAGAMNRTPRSSTRAAAGWLVAFGLILAWSVSSMNNITATSTPASSEEIPANIQARPLGSPQDLPPRASEEATPTALSQRPQLEAEMADLRAASLRRDTELLKFQSVIEDLTITLEKAQDDAAYMARERVLLRDELEAVISLLEAADAKN